MKRSFRFLFALALSLSSFGVVHCVVAQTANPALQPPAMQQPPQQLPPQQTGAQQLSSQAGQQPNGQPQPRQIQNLDQLSPLQRQQLEKAQMQQWQEQERMRQMQVQQQQQWQQRQQQNTQPPSDPRLAQQPGVRTQYLDNPSGAPTGQLPLGQQPLNPNPIGQNLNPQNPGAGNPNQPNPTQPGVGGMAPAPTGSMPPVQIQPARAPFTLTAAEEQALDKVLVEWEKANCAIKTFDCNFNLYEYNAVFGPKDPKGEDIHLRQSTGKLKYAAPDKGQYVTNGVEIFNPAKKSYESTGNEDLKQWACDGKSMYQIDHKQKVRRKINLPPSFQGSGITEGPLPFVFGLKAEKLKARYWMRLITPTELTATQVWIEAYPKYFADAANYQQIKVILNAKDLNPQAIQIVKPGGKDREVYALTGHSVNGIITNLFGPSIVPSLPFGYKDVEETFLDPATPLPTQAQQKQPAFGGILQPGQSPVGKPLGDITNLSPTQPGTDYPNSSQPATGYPSTAQPGLGQPGVGPTNQAMQPGAPLR